MDAVLATLTGVDRAAATGLDVAIATNAGFAAAAGRPLFGEDAQHAKLRLVETVGRHYWGNET